MYYVVDKCLVKCVTILKIGGKVIGVSWTCEIGFATILP